jgi:DNA replication protein DnaC
MKIEDSKQPDTVLIDCQICGKMFAVDDFRNDDLSEIVRMCYEEHRICPECEQQQQAAIQKQSIAQRKAEIAARLPDLLSAAGIEPLYCRDRATGEIFKQPPVRFLAEWIYRHRRENLLISGVTGSGKSTSACFVAAAMICQERKVRYTSLRKLLSQWKEAKTSDQSYAVERMLSGIFNVDVFIIDEVVGKARISESGQELLFEILESVNSGACRSRIWLLGNFYTGSIEDIFSDPEPVRRRLHENFTCVVVDKPAQSTNPITVWKEEK